MVNRKLKRALASATDKQLEVIEHALLKLYRDFEEEDVEDLGLSDITDVLVSLKVIVVVA